MNLIRKFRAVKEYNFSNIRLFWFRNAHQSSKRVITKKTSIDCQQRQPYLENFTTKSFIDIFTNFGRVNACLKLIVSAITMHHKLTQEIINIKNKS